jgi:hypothetical protein
MRVIIINLISMDECKLLGSYSGEVGDDVVIEALLLYYG